MTGFYQLFRLNMNFFLLSPMDDRSSLFNISHDTHSTHPGNTPINSNFNPFTARDSDQTHPHSIFKLRQTGFNIPPETLEKTILSQVEPDSKKNAESVIKRKSMVQLEKQGFKKSGTRHVVNEFGQIVGVVPTLNPSMPEIIDSETDTDSYSESEPEPPADLYNTIKQADHFQSLPSESPFKPSPNGEKVSVDPSLSDQYRTEDHQVSRPSQHLPVLGNRSKIVSSQFSHTEASRKSETQSGRQSKGSMKQSGKPVRKSGDQGKSRSRKRFRVVYKKEHLDKINGNVPDDFELVVRGRRIKEDRAWTRQWKELDRLRKYISEALANDEGLGEYMLSGVKTEFHGEGV